jgi:hypothetical protein
MNFGPPRDVEVALQRAQADGRPVAVLDGSLDEVMVADRYAPFLRGLAPTVNVQIVMGVTHTEMVSDGRGLDAAVTAVHTMPAAAR